MENLTKAHNYGIDPNKADKSLFDRTIDAIDAIKGKGGDENLRMGGVLNAICAIDPTYNAMSPDMAFMNFFGCGTTLEQAEQQLLNIRELTRNSDPNALADFKKLSPEEQEKRIRANSPDAKTKKTVAGYMGIPTAVEVDNPDFDIANARENYEAQLYNKDTFNGFIRLKNAGLGGEIIRDVMRFKTAFDTREEAAEAYVDKFLSTEDKDWAKQFIIGINMFSPTLKHGFWERVRTRIGEDSMDRYFNIKDYVWGSNTDGAVMFSMAKEMGLVDKNGDLVSDPEKISELQKAYEQKQNIGVQRALGVGAWPAEFQKAYKNTDVQKLFAEGKKRFERVKAIRGLMNATKTRFDYSNGEWKTLEEALVNGATSLEYMGIAAAGSLATRNPFGGVMLSSAAMYVDEASSMYADLRYDGNVNESSAAFLSSFYGGFAAAAEQIQLKSLGRAFSGRGKIASAFKEYVKQGFLRSVLNLLAEGGIQTFTELATSTDALATKLWAKNHENATFEEQQLWDEYREECSMIWKTMPLITLGFWGAGAPFRARGYFKDVGADLGSGLKAIYTPNKVIENNVRTRKAIQEAENYYAEIKEKFGKTVSDREWLEKYNGATSEEERTKLLKERYPDDDKRYEATQMLNPQTIARLDSEATRKILEMKAEVARKLFDDEKKIKGGDETSGLSDLDAMETDSGGNPKYSVLESAIDVLGMRDDVVFVNNAQQLSEISGLSVEEAEAQFARDGAKGFFEDKSGKIVVIPSHFNNGADALQTFTHEYGHKIMEKIRKTDLNGYNRMCDEVLSLIGGEGFARSMLPESYSTKGTTQYISDGRAVAEEVLMRVVESVSLKKVLDTRKKSVWARFKNWFAKLFDEKTFAEMLEERIAQIALNVLQKEKAFNVKLSAETSTKAPSKTWKAKTPEADGAEASGEYTVIDASELTASTDEGYDDALQPRNRSRQASKEQVSNIATHLDPERLGDSPTTDLGAPIVDSRGMVVSGNGRILAIRQAYDGGKGEEYGKYVRERAAKMGIEIPESVKNPVLVRRVDNTGKMSLEEFAARSNKSQVAGMSIAEQAVADGRRIVEANLLDTFFPDANGNVLAASNGDFNNAFLNQISGAEMYRNSDGSIRQNLSPRIRVAVLSAMLNPDKREAIERLLDNPEGYNALINGLIQCASNVAELTQKPQYDISDNLSEAVELYIEMHDKGQTVAEFEAQADMFREPPSEETMFLCKLFEENQKTSSGISGVLKQYAEECRKIDTTTQSLFGEEDPSKIEKLRSAYDHYATDLAASSEESPKATWRDVGDSDMPSAEAIQEANRQFKETRDKYFGTALWHKAPNGKESNLTEKQWVWVRTPNFKKWSKDWEDVIKDESGEPKTFKTYAELPDSFKHAYLTTMPQVLRNEINSWKHVSKSPYSNSFYNMSGKTWDNTPQGILRIADHWNFESRGKTHCRTNVEVPNNTHWALGRYNNGTYEILKVIPKDDALSKTQRAQRRQWNEINLQRAENEGIGERAKITKREWSKSGSHFNLNGEETYEGKIVKKSPTMITIRTDDGTVVRGKDFTIIDPSELKSSISVFANDKNGQIKSATDNVGTFNEKNSDIRWRDVSDERSPAELDALNAKFRELYDKYRGGDKKAYEDAVELVAEEARRKGYDVEVYHGTGANGFNVADATSKYEANGEGAQAHGPGLYMAADSNVADGYRRMAGGGDFTRYEINGRDLYNTTLTPSARSALISAKEKGLDINELLIQSKKDSYKYETYKQVKNFLDAEGATVNDVKIIKEKSGRVFDWLHNMKPDEMFDEENPNSVVESPVGKKYQKAWVEDILPILRREYGFDEAELDDVKRRLRSLNSAKTILRNADAILGGDRFREIMLKHGIRGITYNGRQDGRAFVSFEGGPAVKLQDPFTFDDNGELIPLSERFNDKNPDMRWRDVEEQIKTPQFKAWFGNSQVVDKDGKPLHVYHGTGNTNMDYSHFEIFGKPEGRYKVSKSHFFSSNKDIAGSMGSVVYDVFLRIENPLIIEANGDYFSAVRDHTDGIVHYKDLTAEQRKALREAFDVNAKELKENWGESEIDLVQAGVISRPEKTSDEWADYARAKGYDGVIFRNLRDGAGFAETQNPSDNFVVFEPNQIKDATGENSGDFSNENPSIKWRDDTVLMPVDINILVAQNIDALMNAIRKSHKSVLAKKAELERTYPKADNKSKRNISDGLRQFILERFSSELVSIAMLSDEDAKFYNEQFEVEDKFVYTSFGYAIEHYFNRHPNTPIEDYFLLPDTIFNPDKKKEVGRETKDRLGNLIYDASQAFVKEYDKWHVSTIKVDAELTPSGKKLIAFKNFYDDKREPYKNKETIEDFWKNATSSSNYIRGRRYIPNAQKSQSLGISSEINGNGQENSTRLKSLLRQERSENPVIWASMVLAREILLDRKITAAKLDKVIPSDKFDGTKRQYAVERARQIAEQCKATQENYKERLNEAVQLAECDVYWNHEVMQEMYRSFRKDGEEYGIVKQKLFDWLKTERQKDLENVKGLSADELGIDVADAIQNAMEAEPERKPSEVSAKPEEETEELDETAEEGIDDEILGAKEKLAPSTIRDIITKVRMEVTKAVKKAGKDEATRRRVYRNTLVNVLKDAAKKLVYGKEREAIMKKLSDLSQKGYAVIKIKDGERAGQKIDNFTLRAEHIALRIFNRGVRDTKKALIDRMEKALKRAKTPKSVEREDKRKMSAAAELKYNRIRKAINATPKDLEEKIGALAKEINAVDDMGEVKKENFAEYVADIFDQLEILNKFGGFKDKSRAEMAELVEEVEKGYEAEIETQKAHVEELKANADERRQMFLDAIRKSPRNATEDGDFREIMRKLFNSGYLYQQRLQDLCRYSTGELRAKTEEYINDLTNRIYRASASKENEIYLTREDFVSFLETTYGKDAQEVIADLLEKREEFRKYSNKGRPQQLSKSQLLQFIAIAEQSDYKRNIALHRAKSDEVKALSEKISALESDIASMEKGSAERDAATGELKRLDAEFDAAVAVSVDRYIETLKKELSENDLKILDWLRKYYADSRSELSKVNKRVTGFAILPRDTDGMYMPASIENEGGFGEDVNIIPIIPKSMTPRVPHTRDINEDLGAVEIFDNRLQENAQYKNFAELHIELRGLFAHADFHKAVKECLGRDVLQQLLEHTNDILAVRPAKSHNIEAVDKLTNWHALSSLGFNLGVGLRQLTSIPAFAMYVSGGDVFKYAMQGWSALGSHVASKAGVDLGDSAARDAIRDILNHPTTRRRLRVGNSQVLQEMLGALDTGKFLQWWRRNAMIFNKLGDITPMLTVGQGIYRTGVEAYVRKGYMLEAAKEQAMSDFWKIAEMSQQSGATMNMAAWQRRGGSFGRAFGQYTSTTNQFLSKEVLDLKRAIATGDKADIKQAAKTVFINHVILAGGYTLATIAYKAMLGDDWDDDDWYALLASAVGGPLGGLIVFGRFTSALSGSAANFVPFSSFARAVNSAMLLAWDLVTLDFEESAKDADKILKNLVAPYRDIRKAYDNAKEN